MGEERGAFMTVLPEGKWWNILYCTGFSLSNLLLCILGAELFGKFSLAILGVVTICAGGVFASFFLNQTVERQFTVTGNGSSLIVGKFIGLGANSLKGVFDLWEENLWPSYKQDCQDATSEINFFEVFGVLFSGVTGIMSGANLSGDLIAPSKSITSGTLSSCLFTFTTFILLALLTALTCEPALLHNNCMYMVDFTFAKPLVLIGVICATWSASLSNMIGGSKVLQAVAEDILFGPFLNFINRGTINNNPIAAVITTFFWVELIFLMGGLNQIAQLCSVLFLLSYAGVNLACLGLDLASAPNFRPTFKYFSWPTSLVGLIGTSAMMFFTSPLFAAVALLLCLSFTLALNIFSPAKASNWGSISQALIFHQVRKYLLLLDPRKSHIKFWRPQILLLVHKPRTACSLIDFVNSMKKGGLYVLGQVHVGSLASEEVDPLLEKTNDWLALIDHLKVKAFVELTLAASVRRGVEQLVRVSGIGAMKPNTILLGFSDPQDAITDDLSSLSSPYLGLQLDRTEVFSSELKFRVRAGRKKFLDVWPVNLLSPAETDVADNTSLFMFQLACIVNMVPKWRKHKLRVFMCARAADMNIGSKEQELQKLLEVLRIKAETYVLVWDHIASLVEEEGEVTHEYLKEANEFIRLKCSETAVSFIYLPRPPLLPSLHTEYLGRLETLTRDLPPTILVRGVSPVITTTL